MKKIAFSISNLFSIRGTKLAAIFCLTLSALLCYPNVSWSGPHRTLSAQLSHELSADQNTPYWSQYRIDDYHPIGCGPVAWAITYSYWHKHHNKSNLFTDTNISERDYDDPRVVTATDEMAYLTETDFGQAGSAVYGRTWPGKMCQGIEYAKLKGYSESRCLRVRGKEFDKYDDIARYLKADKPVILTIKADGRGAILDHMVVVEKAQKVQEKVAGKWRDREVKYYVNYGHGPNKGSKWISVRQLGINSGQIYSAGSAFLIDVSDTPLPEAASANEAACKDWCAANEQECNMCSHLANCGPGYSSNKSWKGAGQNWYACVKKDSKRSDASEGNRQGCENWCSEHRQDKGCLKCDTRLDCGIGYRNLKSWKGYGTNWHACRKTGESSRDKESEKNHADCQKWCTDNATSKGCVKCSKVRGCKAGFKQLKSWTGKGTNWHACGKNQWGIDSEANNKACWDFCSGEGAPLCDSCSTKRECGSGLTSMKHFTGPGMNWHACRKTGSQSNQAACKQWCDNKSNCKGCSKKPGCGIGLKPMKTFKGPGKNWFACKNR